MLSFVTTRKIAIPLVVETCNNFTGIYASVNLRYKYIFNCSSIMNSNGKGVIQRNERSKMNNALLEIPYSSMNLGFE